MDYRSLLKKYMSLVEMEEGTFFVGKCYWQEMRAIGMTEEECEELESLSNEIVVDKIASRTEGLDSSAVITISPDGTLTYAPPNYLADLKPEMGDG